MAYLDGVYKSYRRTADRIEWQKIDINDLFKECIAHECMDDSDVYFSALVCRLWGYAGRVYTQCNHHVTFEDCHDCIVDAIRYVLKKRVWENPDNSLYNDKNGPDKAIHIAMKRQKGIMLSKMSAQRRMTNFNTISLDEAHENFNDSADGLLFGNENADDSKIRNLVSYYFHYKNDYLDGMIIDCICFGNSKFEISTIVKELKKLNKTNENYFVETYTANREYVRDTIIEIKKSNAKYLEMRIKSLLYTLKREMLNND